MSDHPLTNLTLPLSDNSNGNSGSGSPAGDSSLARELEAELAAIKDEIRRRMEQYQHLKPLYHHYGGSTGLVPPASPAAPSLAFQLMERTAALDVPAVVRILERAKKERIPLFCSDEGAENPTAWDDDGPNGGQPSLPLDSHPSSPATAASASVPRFDQRDLDGQTPLHVAASKGSVQLAKLLLEYGLRPDTMDDAEMTPIDIAREAGHDELARLLDKAAAKLQRPPLSSKTSSTDTLDQSGHLLHHPHHHHQVHHHGPLGAHHHGAAAASSLYSLHQQYQNLTRNTSNASPAMGAAASGASSSFQGRVPSMPTLTFKVPDTFTPTVPADASGTKSPTSSTCTPASPGIRAHLLGGGIPTSPGGSTYLTPGSSSAQQSGGASSFLEADYAVGDDRIKGVIVLVGLPARGKTYFARRVQRFFMFKGAEVQSFSAGDARRRMYPDVSRSSMSNTQAERVSDELALQAARFLAKHRLSEHCAAIIDGLNHSRSLRARLFNGLCSHGIPPTSIVFLEVVVTERTTVERHIANAVADFMAGDSKGVQPDHFGHNPPPPGGGSNMTTPKLAGAAGSAFAAAAANDNDNGSPASGNDSRGTGIFSSGEKNDDDKAAGADAEDEAEVDRIRQMSRRPTIYDLAMRSQHHHNRRSSDAAVSGSPASPPPTTLSDHRASEEQRMLPPQSESITLAPPPQKQSPTSGSGASAAPSSPKTNEPDGEEGDDDDDDVERALTADDFIKKYRNLIRQMEQRYETMTEEHEGGLCFARSLNRSQLKCHNLAYAPLGRAMVKLLMDLHEYNKRFFIATIGETHAEAEGRYGLAASTLLTEKGIAYSKRLAEYLLAHIPQHQIASETTVFTCSAPAARQTVAPMLEQFARIQSALLRGAVMGGGGGGNGDGGGDSSVVSGDDGQQPATSVSPMSSVHGGVSDGVLSITGAMPPTATTSSGGSSSLVRYLHTLDDLSYGDCDGMTRAEALQWFPRHMRNMAENPYGCEWPRGESYAQLMQLRLEQHLSELEAVTVSNIVLVVPHSVAQALCLYFDPARYPVIRPEQAQRVHVPRGHVVCLAGSDKDVPQWVKLD